MRDDLAELLTVRAAAGEVPTSGTDKRRYVAGSSDQPHGRVYGGQVMAGALRAAQATVPNQRPVHSLHCYFLRPGKLGEPIDYEVAMLRDGGSFSARRVQASQCGGEPILSMIASFQQPAESIDHAAQMPDVPGPDELPSTAELLGGIDHPVVQYWVKQRPIDIRHVDTPLYLQAAPEQTDVQCVWLRAFDTLPDDPTIHPAALAYASDYTLLESLLRRHGVGWTVPGMKAASLDHAMWFHRPVRADEWILCVQESPSASGGRGLVRANYFSTDGTHVATSSQELMIRL